MTGPYDWGEALALSDDQRQSILDIMQQTRAKHWPKRAQVLDAMTGIRNAYAKDRPDPEAVGKAYAELFRLKREMIVDRVQAHNRILDVLNDEQRDQLQRGGYGYRQ